jgi:hypothetical protein
MFHLCRIFDESTNIPPYIDGQIPPDLGSGPAPRKYRDRNTLGISRIRFNRNDITNGLVEFMNISNRYRNAAMKNVIRKITMTK